MSEDTSTTAACTNRARGALIARLLEGAWRPTPASCSLPPERFTEVVPVLAATGAGGLAWWRLRGSELRGLPAALQLGWVHAHQTSKATLYQERLEALFDLLRSGGFEPLAIKGWATARLYPDPGMRPLGDFDFVVEPERYDEANAFIARHADPALEVDFGHAELRSPEAYRSAFDRSELVPLGGMSARVLCAEDHLRLLALHFMRHYAYRPLWLCDIAAAVEAGDLDWDRVLGTGRREASWIRAALGLAERLLGARPLGASFNAPDWLAQAVLRTWGAAHTKRYEPALPDLPPMRTHLTPGTLRRPAHVIAAFRMRWQDPLEYSIRNALPIGRRSPVLPRLADGLGRAGDLARRVIVRRPGAIE